MPSERAKAYFTDIVAACDRIAEWMQNAGSPEAASLPNSITRSAIERQLLIISEAAIRLDKLDPSLAAGQAPGIDWPGVRGMGNVLRHRYDMIDEALILDVLTQRLPRLRDAARDALRRLP